MVPELLAAHAVRGANPALALAACSPGLPLLPPLWGWPGSSQVHFSHCAHQNPCLLSGFGLYRCWKHLSWRTVISFFFFFPVDEFLHLFSEDKTNCLFNLPRNKWARGGVGSDAYLLFSWAELLGYFQRDS